jgi:hypothetical protein
MKRTGAAIALSVAAFSFALVSPNFAEGQNAQNREATQAQQGAMNAPSGHNEAMQMVPARAALIKTLDAREARQGQQFTAKLSQTVQLKNGPKLPNGTELIGVVGTDDMQTTGNGTSKLVLRFTEAKLKDGKVVPIKATIVGVFGPEAENSQGYNVQAGDQQPNSWTDQTLQVDQIGALSGVDLHSKIASRNSGVFVSSKKDDVKLKNGSELTLAIAANPNSQTAINGQNGGY